MPLTTTTKPPDTPARASGLPVGISSATKMNGSVIARTVNLPVFLDAFRQRYQALAHVARAELSRGQRDTGTPEP